MCGSSSNGSAAVLVTGEADLALGGDQGGSIRLPASWSGCVGHKPTYGLVPYTGIFPIELTIDHVGPMARTVADCAQMLEVLAGEDGLDPRQVGVRVTPYVDGLDRGPEGLRVGILREGFDRPGMSEADVDAAVREAAESLAAAGAGVEEVSVPMHTDGLAIWNGVAIEGATDLMVRGDAFGTNHKGHYTTDLVDFYGRARRMRAQTTRSRSSSRCCSAITCPSATTTTTTPRRRTSGAAWRPRTAKRSSASTSSRCRRRR